MTDQEDILDKYDQTLDNYQQYYLQKTKQDDDPKELVGPGDSYEEMGEWQVNLLEQHGLTSEDKVVDLGCGVLRAGKPLIKKLAPGNYTGIDISLRTLLEGHKTLHEEKLGHKKPVLIQNRDLKFQRLPPENRGDYLLIQSVWTHLPPKELKTCIQNMHKLIKDNATIIATLYTNNQLNEPKAANNGVDWYYPPLDIKKLLNKTGYNVQKLDADHPNNLITLKITPK